MKENVGTADRKMRFVLGPALIGAGLTVLGGRRGTLAGLATIVAGVLVVESAITRVCPVSTLAGVDSRGRKQRARDLGGAVRQSLRPGRTIP